MATATHHTTAPTPLRRGRRAASLPVDPAGAARAAGLRYVSDTMPGIRRVQTGDAVGYVGPDGRPVEDREELARIAALGIPPAWTDVWICPHPRGHLQATGRDARGRKQYRYHVQWREVRDETKYERMIAFGRALPRLRRRVDADLALPGLPRAKVLATVVRLLETTLIRVGNDEYARQNSHYGLTTMRVEHVEVTTSAVSFRFVGKSGKEHEISVRDRHLARIVRRCRDLPGHELFQYIDEHGERHAVDSSDVNAYLREVTGEEFTAKDFRTWAGTVLASRALQEFESFDSQTQAKKNVVQAIEAVAARLGNTPTVCRKCYVHPAVIESYLDGTMIEALKQRVEHEIEDALHDLAPEEAAVLAFLQQRLAREEQHARAAG